MNFYLNTATVLATLTFWGWSAANFVSGDRSWLVPKTTLMVSTFFMLYRTTVRENYDDKYWSYNPLMLLMLFLGVIANGIIVDWKFAIERLAASVATGAIFASVILLCVAGWGGQTKTSEPTEEINPN